MIGCLWTRVRKQPNIALYFESENELEFYNFEARPSVESVYQKNNLLVSQEKHLLWVLKRTVSMRRFFWAPKTYVKLMGKKIFKILRSAFLFSMFVLGPLYSDPIIILGPRFVQTKKSKIRRLLDYLSAFLKNCLWITKMVWSRLSPGRFHFKIRNLKS